MKYIDADRLRAEIEKNKNMIDGMFTEGDDSVYDGENDAYNRVLRIIDSLQREQPEINIPSDGSGAMGTTPPKFKLDVKPVVPELDLEKVLSGFTGYYAHENSGEYPSAIDIARHFYELGIKAKKQ